MPFTKIKPPGLKLPSGPLTDPILLNAIHHIFGDDTPTEFVDRYFLDVSREMRFQKLFYLAASIGIDIRAPDGWQKLALELATAYVPGFQVARPKPPRKKSRWSYKSQNLLVEEVEKRRAIGKSERQVCRNLEDEKLILDKKGIPFKAGELRSQLKELRESGWYEFIKGNFDTLE